jgi:hypothetical protein
MMENKVWRLNEVERNNEHSIFSTCSKEDEMNHTLNSEGTKICRDEILDMRFKDTDTEINIRRKADVRLKSNGRRLVYI